MMFAHATNSRALLRTVTAALAAALLAGSPLFASRAQAQTGDDKATEKTDKTDKTDKPEHPEPAKPAADARKP